jgi:hypothetical protein
MGRDSITLPMRRASGSGWFEETVRAKDRRLARSGISNEGCIKPQGVSVEMGIAFKPDIQEERLQFRGPGLKPYWGKPAVRNFRGGIGNGGMV